MKKNSRDKLYSAIEDLVHQHPPSFSSDFIPTGLADYGAEEIKSIIDTLLEGHLGLSKKGHEFETAFAHYLGVNKSLLVNSGSSANLIALEGIKKIWGLDKREVITSACGFPTTLNPIIQLGYKPVFVDIDKTYNISLEAIQNALTDNTAGIVFSHTLGNPSKIDDIIDIANKNNLFVLEDCCDAYGSKYDGKMCGSFGTASTCSFYPAHNITLGGEGGLVATNNKDIYTFMKSFRDWGRECSCDAGQDNKCGKRFDCEIGGVPYDHKYVYSEVGYNLKPTEMQAAMGLVQLKRIEEFNKKRRKNYKIFKDFFSCLDNYFELPEINPKSDPVFFGLPLTIKSQKIDRQNFIKYLNEKKIATRYIFGGNLLYHPAYNNIEHRISGNLNQTNKVLKDSFWIGIHPGINENCIDYIMTQFKEYIKLKK